MKKEFEAFNKEDIELIKSLNTPKKIQDFINQLEINFEKQGETCYSPKTVLKMGRAHCMEGAMLAACILRFHRHEPLILDIEATEKDFDHVVTLFKINKHWGAISKTNHSVLRYREPVYKTIRELVMSFFHEYFTDEGIKTMRSFSSPVNLKKFDKNNWMTSEADVWFIPDYLADMKHNKILNKSQVKSLRKADKIEIDAGKLTEFKGNSKI